MGYSPSPRRRLSDGPPPRRYTGFSNERLSPERQFRPSRRNTERDDDEFDVSYGGEPLPALAASWEPQPATESYDFLNTSPRTLSPTSGSYITEKNISSIPSYVEGIENDGTKAGEVEEAGLSWTVTLPANNEQSMPYTHISDSNSAWKARKYHDKKIGTTTLESIYSIKYSTGEMGQGKITLFCPQGPIRDNEDSALVQAKWLHVQRSSMSVRVLEKLVMDCPIINADIRRVAVLLLDSVEKSFLRESENGAYIEPGSVLRLTGTRQVLHDAHNFVVTEPVIFAAFPFIELNSSKNNSGSRESEDFYPRTLLQNLYGFDVVTSRGKNQVIHKMPVNCQPDNTLFVNQLWCLVIGSDILITLADRSPDDFLGATIEKRTDYVRQPLRIEVVDVNGFQHSMSISSKTPWVDFFRHVIYTVHGNLIGIMDYELVDQADEVVTTERWAELAETTRPSLLKFQLVKRKASASRSSSISSRRSSRSGIRRLLQPDYGYRDSSRTSVSRNHADKYDENPSSSEKRSSIQRASTPRRRRTSRSSMDAQWHSLSSKKKTRQSGTQPEIFTETDIQGLYSQSSPTVVTLESSEGKYSEPERISPSLQYIQSVGGSSGGASDKSDFSPRNVAQLPEQQQLPSSGDFDKGSPLVGLSTDGLSLMYEQQAPVSNIEEQGEIAISLEGNYSYINDGYTNKTSKKEAPDVLIAKDAASSNENVETRLSNDGSNEREEMSTSQSHTPATMYQKVQIEDGFETSDENDDIRKRTYSGSTGADLPGISSQLNLDDVLAPNKEHNSDSAYNSERSPEMRFVFLNDTSFPRNSSHERYHSRSSSLSNSTDESLYSRGRTRIRKRRAWTRETPSLAHSSSSRPAVRFQPQVRNTKKDSVEMSPYGSSNATKVETRPPQTAVPFFFWKQQSMTSTFSSLGSPEQVLIKLLDQIDEHISNDPVSKYYLKVPEMTLEDVLTRQESLREPDWEKESKTVRGESGKAKISLGQRTIDIRTDNLFAFRLSENQVGKGNKESGQNNTESVEAPSTHLSNEEAIKPNTGRRESNPDPEYDPSSINISQDRGQHEQTQFSQTQALGLMSHDKTLARQLVETSQQIIWSFIPNTGGSVIHTLLKRLWGCVDIMCLQLFWEENERGRESECKYIISNFCSQVKKTDPHRQKPTSEKIHYLHCEDCKTAKSYESAIDALDHLHERHIECKHNDSDRPYDDPCYVWLHRSWPYGYPMRSSRDGLLGIMEDFIEELSYISNYVRELHSMTTTNSLANDAVSTPPLPMNITLAFQQIVKMFVFRSKQLSLINRRRRLISGSSLGNFPLIQRIDRKIEELFSLEMDANERIIDRLESAKKDIFLSGIGPHSEILEAETVRVQFLALAFMSGIQRPLFQPSATRHSQVKDTLLQLYKDYTSRLHFEANNRPRKRVFLDIHGLEEELQALDKLVDSQESCLYNFLTLIDPLTSRYTTETRLREFRVEVQFGNDQLHHRIEKRREIDNLATRLWILKDQVKQTIEIMEEDHGKAIRVFTVVTLFFLPLSFVSSFLGMNTTDVRNSEWNQAIFWITAVPITVGVLSLAFIYGYKGEEIRDWMIQVLQTRSRQDTPSAFYEMSGRASLETRQKDWNPAITAGQNATERRGFSSLVRSRIKNVPGWQHYMKDTFKVSDGLDGKVSIRRRTTEDSLAPMRHE